LARARPKRGIELPPGKHTLQLVLGDAGHFPFNPPVVSQKITITVNSVEFSPSA
jgi:hypothetical protein